MRMNEDIRSRDHPPKNAGVTFEGKSINSKFLRIGGVTFVTLLYNFPFFGFCKGNTFIFCYVLITIYAKVKLPPLLTPLNPIFLDNIVTYVTNVVKII